MSVARDPADLMRESLVELRRLRSRVQELEADRAVPIAVCGIGCRFPGGCDTPDTFWRLLREGRDAVGYPPAGRWPDDARSYAGGFLDSIDGFDALFFGISPREATTMDPQHRLLLETAWEALERAAMPADRLRRSSTGVFLGVATNEYEQLARAAGVTDMYSGLGSMRSIAGGRLSYCLGLQGPNLVLDTACSSSLVAVHLAVESLRRRECDLALAGGVNLMLTPDSFEILGRLQALAPNGRCKAFDAAADGFGRAEGCGIVVLKRLPEAVRDLDPVLAVVYGSAVNHDGLSSGLTVPNVAAQAAVIRTALTAAGIGPDDIDYLEAHGTGTQLGDPAEASAITQVFSPRAKAHVLRLGTVKTNIGHAEAAAGIAGFIKTVLALVNEEIPLSLHFSTANPHIAWQALPARVAEANVRWPRNGGRRMAGVSAFGLSGTNAHVVIGEAPIAMARSVAARESHVLTLSARSEGALRELAERWIDHLRERAYLRAGDVCFTANSGRSVFAWRLAVMGRDTAELCEALHRFLSGGTDRVWHGYAAPPLLGAEAPTADNLPPAELAAKWVNGATVDWDALDRPFALQRLALPTYAWQRQRYWIAPASSTGDIASEVQSRLDGMISDAAIEPYWRALERLEEISLAYVLRAFAALGYGFEAASRFTLSELRSRLRIADKHAAFFERLISMLVEGGVLREEPAADRAEAAWRVAQKPVPRDPELLSTELLRECPEAATEIELLQRCGRHLAPVLLAEADPLAILFPEGGNDLLARLYGDAPFARIMNDAVCEVVELLATRHPLGQTLRVLEIGAGTGATTAHVLRRLEGRDFRYVFTDVSRPFLRHAQERFRSDSRVEYRLFDVEKPPGEQGLAEGEYDLVIAANVMHAAAEIRPALRQAQQLLAKSGVLLLMETTAPQRWVDLFAGYTGGWWRFRDRNLRPVHPLLGLSTWLDVLRETGFRGACGIEPKRNGSTLPARPAILLGEAAGNRTSRPASEPCSEAPCEPSSTALHTDNSDLTHIIRCETAAVLGLSQAQWPELTQGFFEVGLDSLGAVELSARLSKVLGVPVATTDLFDFPNVAALREHLRAKLTPETQGEDRSIAPANNLDHAIAVIGMACRFPGDAVTPDDYWRLLSEGVDAVCEVPRGRWRSMPNEPVGVRFGGFLREVDRFDAEFFGISPREAVLLDPQQRLLLEVAWEAFETAAWIPDRNAGEPVGVFLGMATSDYAGVARDADAGEGSGVFGVTGISNYAAAGRLSCFFGLTGPSLVLDTACSSSLVAVHHAVQSIRRGECRMALAGGVNVILSPEPGLALADAQMLSPDGRCKSFDASANGMIRAEGCGLVLVERLTDAVQAGHTVLAIVHGSAVNQDGARSALTVPNGRMQEAVIRKALADASLAPEQIGYVEAHGAGTALGDPIEAAALHRVYGEAHSSDHPVLVGSVKSNLGHLEAAAGIAAFIKVVLAVERGDIPASLHFHEPNPQLDWDEINVRVTAARERWPRTSPRFAGVSSFGASGTNAHVIVGEAPPRRSAVDATAGPVVLCLSARTPRALRELAERYLRHFDIHPELDAASVCATAIHGRAWFSWRLAVVGSDLRELRDGLAEFLAGHDAEHVFIGRAADDVSVVTSGSLEELADAWVRGAVATGDVIAPAPWRRVPLPGYPWQRERYWAGLHPLLGNKMEDPTSGEVRWAFVVSPETHAFLEAHQVGDSMVFPGSGYAEIALAALRSLRLGRELEIRHFEIDRALLFEPDAPVPMQISMEPQTESDWRFQIFSTAASGAVMHARGFAGRASTEIAPLAEADESSLLPSIPAHGWVLPPTALDAVLGSFGPAAQSTRPAYMQVGFERFVWRKRPNGQLAAALKWRPPVDGDGLRSADIDVRDSSGQVVWALRGLQFRRVAEGNLPDQVHAPWRDWLYGIEWSPRPLIGAGGLRFNAAEYRADLESASRSWPELAALRRYTEATALLNGIAAGYLRRSPPDVTAATNQRLIKRCREILAAHNGIPFTPEAGLERTRREYPDASAEADLIERCGNALPALFSGDCDAVELLFPGGDLAVASRLYSESPGSRMMNRLLGSVVRRMMDSLPATRGMRILELGAGTGGTTAAVLPEVDAERVEYVFSDLSPLFLERARERFRSYSSLSFATLDVESDPVTQGFEEGAFDLVIAANVLHATKSLSESLSHVRRLLAPGGCLLLIEGSARLDWIDLTFGFTDGWWRFEDADVRRDYPLLAPDGWIRALERAGFATPCNLAERTDGVALQSGLLAAFAPVVAGRKLIFANSDGFADSLGGTVVRAGKSYGRTSENEIEIDPFDPSHYDRLLQENPASSIASLWGMDTNADAAAACEFCCRSALLLLQAILKQDGIRPAVAFVTRNAQPLGDVEIEPSGAALWGLIRTARLEHPELKLRLLDFDTLRPELLEQELAASGTDTAVVRNGKRFAAGLARLHVAPAAPAFAANETYLITGGLHGIGLHTAKWMIRHGARCLILMGRSQPDEQIRSQLAETGATLHIVTADVGDRESLRAALSSTGELPPIRGIVHSAGVFEDKLLRQHEWEPFENVFRAKVAGSLNLCALAREWELRFFVMFSSGASLNGSAGLANYAAANAFQDALAHRLRRDGMPALSINWGAWKDTGMAAAVGAEREVRWTAEGLRQMDPSLALQAFGAIVTGFRGAQVAVVEVDWPRFLEQHDSAPWRPFLDRFRGDADAQGKVRQQKMLGAVNAAAPDQRRAVLETLIRREVARLLGLPEGELPQTNAGFFEMGFDSLLSLELRNRLQAELGQELQATLTFQHTNIAALTNHLAGRMGFPMPQARKAAGAAAAFSSTAKAVTGYSVQQLDEFFSEALEALNRTAP